MIYYGKTAKSIFRKINQNESIKTKGYFKDGDSWIVFDNCTGDNYVEDFVSENRAIAWLLLFDVFDESFRMRNITKRLIYIENEGILKISHKNENLVCEFHSFSMYSAIRTSLLSLLRDISNLLKDYITFLKVF